MSRRIPAAPARRRLGGAVLVLVGLVVAIVVLLPGGSGDDKPTRRRARPSSVRLVAVAPLGLAFAYPRTWKREIDGLVIRLRSPDGTAILTVSSPVEGRAAPRIESALAQTLEQRLAPARIVSHRDGTLGGRPVSSFELTGRSAGKPVRALVLVDDTRFRTYAVTLLTPLRPSRRRLSEVRQILSTVRFAKPVASKR